jgi:CRISPR-associated endonuclease Cas2
VDFDITSPRRPRRVARLLEKHAWRLQYSLFVGRWNDREFEAVWTSVAVLIHPRRHDMQAWPLPEQADIAPWGLT